MQTNLILTQAPLHRVYYGRSRLFIPGGGWRAPYSIATGSGQVALTRTELLLHLISHAREGGFEFKKWFRQHAARPWTTPVDAVEWLAQGSRAHLLLFSHGFARTFFREGERIRFIQPAMLYQRVAADGTVRSVQRRAHTRHSNRQDVWLYHLREMAAAEEPLRYIRRYLLLEETLAEVARPVPVPALAPAPPEPTPSNPDEAVPDYDDELLVRE